MLRSSAHGAGIVGNMICTCPPSRSLSASEDEPHRPRRINLRPCETRGGR